MIEFSSPQIVGRGVPVALALLTLPLAAVTVSPDQAKTAAGNWLRYGETLGCPVPGKVVSVRTHAGADGNGFHIVGTDGGGFVVMSADTEFEPVIAFAGSGGMSVGEENPLWEMIRRDLAARHEALNRPGVHASFGSGSGGRGRTPSEKWEALLAEPSVIGAPLRRSASLASVPDERVAPMLKTRWSQKDVNNYGTGDPCYNYYTPNNYACGCVAVSCAQVMRYFRHPVKAVTPLDYACRIDNRSVMLRQMGGVYDWDAMTEVPKDGVTEEGRQAIGKLMYDVGLACYTEYSSLASFAAVYSFQPALVKNFGYAGAECAVYENGMPVADFKLAVRSNMDSRAPIVIGIGGSQGLHSAVVDGYGYADGTLYIHMNMGWIGLEDAWYAPPDLGRFNIVNCLVYNIYPEGTAKSSIVSGRVVSAFDGRAIAGARVQAKYGTTVQDAVTDGNGIYSLRLAGGKSYAFSASFEGVSTNRDALVSVKACVSTPVNRDGYTLGSRPMINNLVDVDFSLDYRPPPGYTVSFLPGEGAGTMPDMHIERECVSALPASGFEGPGDGRRFVGWVCEETGTFYDAGALVFNLASDGDRMTMTAVWRYSD